MSRIGMILVCCLALATTAIGQRTSPKNCRIGEVAFACPKGLKPLRIEPAPDLALFFRKDFGLFVASPKPGFDEQKLTSEVTKTVLAKAFPKELQSYEWKPLKFSDVVSRFEIGGGMAQGFNGSMGIVVKYRHLKVKDKEILVGYAAELARGTDASENFQRGLGGDSLGTIAGCEASVEVIYSITGERINKANPPCSLDVMETR
jgi:hypothetical protein